jgi:hypothetical protein
LFLSCENEARWYPSADVFVNNYYEYNIATGRALSIWQQAVKSEGGNEKYTHYHMEHTNT